MKQQDKISASNIVLYVCGIIPVVWAALLTAPALSGGLPEIIQRLTASLENPFRITIVQDTTKCILLFLLAYGMGIGIYLSTAKNYRRKEEHGSAKWGNSRAINKKYKDADTFQNKLLTQNTTIGFNSKKHRRNMNVLVVGGSGAGKTRFYCKPNIMQANTSFVVLDPNGKIVLL